jgi:hypothetical protein
MRTVLPDRSLTMTIQPAKSATAESDLDIVKRHVRSAELRIASRRKLIAFLAARRQLLKQAREPLHLFEVTRQAHVDHLVHVEDGARRRALLAGFLVGCLSGAIAISILGDWAWSLPVLLSFAAIAVR